MGALLCHTRGKFARVRSSLGIISANVLGAVSGYLVILFLANTSTTQDLGLYSLIAALTAIVIAFFDTVIFQLVSQHLRTSLSDSSNRYIRPRSLLVVTLSVALTLPFSIVAAAFFDEPLLYLAITLYVAGQAGYSSLTSSGIFYRKLRNFVLQQVRGAVWVILPLLAALALNAELNYVEALFLIGLARTTFFVVELFLLSITRNTETRPLSSRHLLQVLLSPKARAATGKLSARQFLSSLSAQADTLGMGLAGATEVARYQVLQRPLLALGVVNVAIDQHSMRSGLAGESARIRSFLFLAVTLCIGWPLAAVAMSHVVSLLVPSDLEPPLSAAAVLGLGLGVGGLASFLGPRLLLAGKNTLLLSASLVRLLVIATSLVILVPTWGVLGGALSVLFANIAVVCIYLPASARSLD